MVFRPTGIRFSGHPIPAEELSLPHSWPTGHVTMPGLRRGYHVPHLRVTTGVGASYIPGTAMLTRPTNGPQPAPAASQRPVPTPRCNIPSSGASDNETSTKVQAIHPSDLPLACSPRMERAPLGFYPELRTPPLPATHVRVGTGLKHRPRTTQPTTSPPIRESTHKVRPRVATTGSDHCSRCSPGSHCPQKNSG